jgi:hypothetical protein
MYEAVEHTYLPYKCMLNQLKLAASRNNQDCSQCHQDDCPHPPGDALDVFTWAVRVHVIAPYSLNGELSS